MLGIKQCFGPPAVAVAAFLAAACSSGAPAGPVGQQPGAPASDAASGAAERLTGDIIVDGSSTVYPVTAAAAEEFSMVESGVRVSVGISGTGGGFKLFCAGETDISDASRPIKPEEAAACAAAGIDYIEIPVAYDGLAVVVNPANTWAECVTVAELKTIWEPAAQGRITKWSQVRDGWPDEPLVLLGAGSDSGTFDYFTEAVTGETKASRGDYQATEDDNVTVTGVAGDKNALGFLGYAYVVENEGKMKAVGIEQSDGTCVAPSFDTVKDATYQPLSRPLFIYVSTVAAQRPEVRRFIEYYLSPEFTSLIQTPEIGYVTLDQEIYSAGLERLRAGTTGTLWPQGAEVGATLDRYLGR